MFQSEQLNLDLNDTAEIMHMYDLECDLKISHPTSKTPLSDHKAKRSNFSTLDICSKQVQKFSVLFGDSVAPEIFSSVQDTSMSQNPERSDKNEKHLKLNTPATDGYELESCGQTLPKEGRGVIANKDVPKRDLG